MDRRSERFSVRESGFSSYYADDQRGSRGGYKGRRGGGPSGGGPSTATGVAGGSGIRPQHSNSYYNNDRYYYDEEAEYYDYRDSKRQRSESHYYEQSEPIHRPSRTQYNDRSPPPLPPPPPPKASSYHPSDSSSKRSLPTGPRGAATNYKRSKIPVTNRVNDNNNSSSSSRTLKRIDGDDDEDDDLLEVLHQKNNNNNVNKSNNRNSNNNNNNHSNSSNINNNNNNNNRNVKNANKTVDSTSKPKSIINTKFVFMKRVEVKGSMHERMQQVGEGTYGKVYKARNVTTGEVVALKRLRLEIEREGFPITANREIGLLQSFQHQNIVGLNEMMIEKNSVYMVFPYMNHDLSGILQQTNIIINDGEKKNIIRQLLSGIDYLHKKQVIHRDIKGSNILLNNEGIVKITDFGLARKMKNIDERVQSPNYTNRVITLWYRPPEILLGSTDYGKAVDIWGIGCLLLELFTRQAVFQGIDEIDQLWKVYDVMGTITIEDWPDSDKLPWFEMLRPNFRSHSKFNERFGKMMSPKCFELAQSLLQMNPDKRITANDALNHPYFDEEPLQQKLGFLATVEGEWHEFEAKKKRRQQRDAAKQRDKK